MKVTCEYCNKRYNVEKNEYICPSCGGRYRYDMSEGRDTYDSIKNTEGLYDKGQKTETQRERTTGKTGGVGLFVYCFFCFAVTAVIVFILLVTVVTVSYNLKNAKKESDRHIENVQKMEDIPVSHQKVDETISYLRTDESVVWFDIKEVKRITDTQIPIPDGYELICLSYEAKDGRDNSYETDNIYDVEVIPYIYTKGGQYLKSVSYDVEGLFGISTDECYELHISSGFDYTEGSIYFITKTDDIESIVLYYMHRDDNYDYDEVEKIVFVDEVEVSR